VVAQAPDALARVVADHVVGRALVRERGKPFGEGEKIGVGGGHDRASVSDDRPRPYPRRRPAP
jgi:hypothetical protein